MIDFTLSEEHDLLAQSIGVGRRDVAPYIRENDRKHHFDRERILGGMAKLGLLGISVPQQYGGAGMDYSRWAWRARSWNTSTPRCASSCRSTPD